MGPEFFNNMDSPNNAFGAEDSKAWKYVTRALTLTCRHNTQQNTKKATCDQDNLSMRLGRPPIQSRTRALTHRGICAPIRIHLYTHTRAHKRTHPAHT